MGVLLDPADIRTWVTGTEDDAKALAQPWPDGLLQIEEATDVDWSGP
jgi:putative SOS response-associated peptidase YedK